MDFNGRGCTKLDRRQLFLKCSSRQSDDSIGLGPDIRRAARQIGRANPRRSTTHCLTCLYLASVLLDVFLSFNFGFYSLYFIDIPEVLAEANQVL
jgi:hypothetical protein